MDKQHLKPLPLLRVFLFGLIGLVALDGNSQPGMEGDPTEGLNIQTQISFNNAVANTDLHYDFNAVNWYYIAFTKPISGNGTLFINGESIGEIAWDSQTYDHFVLNIGASYLVSYDGYFSGTIDEIRVTNKIKDATELKDHFDADQPFAVEDQTAFIWKFDEGSGNQFFNANNDLTGNLYGDPTWVEGKYGKAIKYDGIDDRGRVNVDLVEYNVTYEFWVKFDGGTSESSQTIIQPYGSTTSIDLKIQQTVTEQEPPAPEDVIFSLPVLESPKETEVIIPVTVQEFIDILTVQQTISWDPAVLQFVDVQDFGLNDMDENSFNLFEPGKLTWVWTPDDLLPVTVDDESVIFNIVFNVIGQQGSSTRIEFEDDPTGREVSDGEDNVLSVVYNDGSLMILDEIQIAGYIKTQKGEALSQVDVILAGADEQSATTDEFGWYSFHVIPGLEYTISPVFDGAAADAGVSTLDLVIMQWHILGMKYLMSDYDLIASDVNESGSLTSMDVAQTRSVILHLDESFGDRNAIEFINHAYTGVPDIFDYQNFLAITPATAQNDLNFTVVKLGDAGRSWSVNQSGDRKQGLEELEIIIEPGQVAGNTINIPLKAVDFQEMIGLQFTLEWDPQVYQFERLVDQELHFDANLDMVNSGKLTVLWSSENLSGVSLGDQSVLSGIEFTQLLDTDPQITITSGVTRALAFDADLETKGVKARSNILDNVRRKVLTVYPNPASNVLYVNGTSLNSEYWIVTATGSIIKSGSFLGAKEINIEDLKKGVYVLQLQDEQQGRVNKKFVKQ